MRILLVPTLLLAGCGGGVDAGTLVAELRVMAIVPDAPELSPGQSTPAMVRVLDPEGAGADVWVWTCSPFEGGCVGDPPSPVSAPIGDGHVAATLSADPALSAVATETPEVLALAWALACVPGVCEGFFDDSAATLDPVGRMKTVPLAGTSLASWPLAVSTRDDPHSSPTLQGAISGEALELRASTADGRAWAYATSGGFETSSVRPVDGVIRFTWIAPEVSEGPTEILVVYHDEVGGVATWDAVIP